MVDVPPETPVATPDPFMVATAVLLLLHTPPGVTSAKAVVLLTHTLKVPVMGETTGNGFTVTSAVTKAVQPLPLVTV